MASNQANDSWMILAEDRIKYEAQFLQLKPVNGMITGEKVKPILMKSGLSTAVLGHIWGLADINGDGKLDKKEFAIAIHLIRKKLQGCELPKTLPPCLKADSLPAVSSVSKAVTSASQAVTSQLEAVPSPATPTSLHLASTHVTLTTGEVPSSTGVVPHVTQTSPTSIPATEAPKPVTATRGIKPESAISSLSSYSNGSSVTATVSLVSTSSDAKTRGDSWPLSDADLTRYKQLFFRKDQKKRGFLTGLEAKAILSESGLPVKVLAQIWNLADVDDDGRLVLEEFQIAMHFVGVAKSGNLIPSSLPPEFVPLSFRKSRASEGTIPAIQPPTVGSKKTSDKFSSTAPAGGKSVSAAISQSSVPSVMVQVPATKPSVDLLLLDDPFGAPPAELPVPLLEQGLFGKGTEEGLQKTEESTPPDVLSGCSVVWNVATPNTSQVSTQGESEQQDLDDLQSPCQSEIEKESLSAPLPDVTSVVKQDEELGEGVEVENHMPVPELQITEVEDEPDSDTENAEHVAMEKAEELDQEEKEEKKGETQQTKNEEAEEHKQLEREKQLKLEKEMQELERLRQMELENQRLLELEKQKQAEIERQKRLLVERLRQEELEKLKQLEQDRQKQLEKEKEEQRKKAQEQKEAMQRELQKQRQLDWEHQRRDQLIILKARCQNIQDQLEKDTTRLKKDLVTANNKKMEVKAKIEKTRNIVGEYTSAIEAMRLIRDKKFAAINSLQLKIEESKRKLAVNQQERQLLDTQLLSCDQHLGDTYKVVLKSCTKKKATIDSLVEQLTKIDQDVAKKMEMIENNNTKLSELKNRMNALHTEVKTLQHTLVSKKQQWEARNQFGQATLEEKKRKLNEVAVNDEEMLAAGYKPYTALYQFNARSRDELSLQPGVTVWVKMDQTGLESGWMIGKLNGMEGCFPEAYVQPAEEEETISAVPDADAVVEEAKSDEIEGSPLRGSSVDDIKAAGNDMASTLTTSVQSSFVSVPSTSVVTEEVIVDKGLKAQAIYTWMAKKDNHLTFNTGDVIVIKEQQEMWWLGELNGKVGWFPKSYIKLLDECDTQAAEPGLDMAPASLSTEPSAEATLVTSSVAATATEPPQPGELYVAAYPYTSDESGDLTFSLGDIITVISSDGEWWTGCIDDRSGIFPANFVKKMDVPQPITTQKEAVETSQKLSTIKKPEIATVIAAYEATGSEQLSLQPGQLIQVRKKTETGWWEGELQVRGQKRRIGWFPANYVKLLGQGSGSRSSVDNSSSCSGSPIQKPLDVKSITSEVSPSLSGTERRAVKMMALYDYQSQCEDELTFNKGDIINIVSKEHTDWWKGELSGKTGIFPANYVGHLPDNMPK